MLKLLYKLIPVILITAVVFISCGSASDSGVMQAEDPAYIPPPPVKKAPETIVIEKAPEKPAPIEPQPQAPREPQQKQQKQASGNFFFKLLVATAKAIGVILLAAGGYLLYKKIIAGKIPAKPPGQDVEEPKTVAEAVSSYIKHKLEK